MPRSSETVLPSRSALTRICVPSALTAQAYSGAIVLIVLLWKSRVRESVLRSTSDDRMWRPSPVAVSRTSLETNRGWMSCWISRVTRISPDPSLATT
jgi:hypothetical protein